MAERLNQSHGPTVVVIPMKGFTSIHPPPPKEPLPESAKRFAAFVRALMDLSEPGLLAFREELTKHLRPEVEVVSLDTGFNDPDYPHAILRLFDEMTAMG